MEKVTDFVVRFARDAAIASTAVIAGKLYDKVSDQAYTKALELKKKYWDERQVKTIADFKGVISDEKVNETK